MDTKIWAVLIAALFSLFGVLLGGYIQSYLHKQTEKKEKMVAEGAVALYLCRLRMLFNSFSTEEGTYKNLAIGVTANENNYDEVNMMKDLIARHDPFLLVKLFDIKQRLHNIGKYTASYHKLKDQGSHYKELQPYIGWIQIDAKGGVCDICVFRGHPATHFGMVRPPISVSSGHLFRHHPAPMMA